ncbi:hypothetical protein RIF29_19766 [Crotalaria pallida]|uniref:Uncharacterized protein n=1 Tax=Crotalaria pallida TaxID=3830 RepID=A0AAN9F0G4_CROPI
MSESFRRLSVPCWFRTLTTTPLYHTPLNLIPYPTPHSSFPPFHFLSSILLSHPTVNCLTQTLTPFLNPQHQHRDPRIGLGSVSE